MHKEWERRSVADETNLMLRLDGGLEVDANETEDRQRSYHVGIQRMADNFSELLRRGLLLRFY